MATVRNHHKHSPKSSLLPTLPTQAHSNKHHTNLGDIVFSGVEVSELGVLLSDVVGSLLSHARLQLLGDMQKLLDERQTDNLGTAMFEVALVMGKVWAGGSLMDNIQRLLTQHTHPLLPFSCRAGNCS